MTDTPLIPSSFNTTALLPHPEEHTPLAPGCVQGVMITLPAELCAPTFAQCTRWFADRDEVLWVDSGVSQKAEQGYIILEWDECEIDPLFLALLRDDEDIHDYLLYEREKESE